MKTFATILALAGLVAAAQAACPNMCSGHGSCTADDQCRCWKGYSGYDCAQRACPMVEAWAVDGELPHGYAECAGKGICDRGTGTCACFDGYEGRGCERSSCPSGCSGHGKCRLIADLPGYSTARNTEHDDGSNDWTAYGWDEKAISACVCDGGYMGPDCSQRVCPFGDDPMTVCEQGDLQQVQRVRYSIRGDFAGSALTNARLENDQFAMRFKSYADEVFYTSAVDGIFGLSGHGDARVASALDSAATCTDGVGAFGELTAVTYSAAPTTSVTAGALVGASADRGDGALQVNVFSDGDFDGAGSGGIVYASVVTGSEGTTYAVGDLVTVDPATGSDYAVLRVTSVGGSGDVTGIEVVRGGSGYTDNVGRYLVDDLSIPIHYQGGLAQAAGVEYVELTITAAGGVISAATVDNGASLTQWPEDRSVAVTTCASGRGNGDAVLAISDTAGTPAAAVSAGGTGYVTGDTCYGFPVGGGFSAVLLATSGTTLPASGADYAVISAGSGYVVGDFILFRTSATPASNDGFITVATIDANGGVASWVAHDGTAVNTPTGASFAALTDVATKGGQGATITVVHGTGLATVVSGGYGYMSTDTGMQTATATDGTWIAGDDNCDADGSTAATAAGDLAAANLEAALEAVPNFRIRSVTATYNSADAMQMQTVGGGEYLRNHLYVTFNHVDEGNSYGAQNMLMCPHSRMVARADGDNRLATVSTFGCGAAGCQPRVQQPRAVTYSGRSEARAWAPIDYSIIADATVGFTADSVLTCVNGGLDGTEFDTCAAGDDTHQGVVRVLLANDGTSWHVWAAASGAAAPAVGPTVPAFDFATAKRYAEVADMAAGKAWGHYVYFGIMGDLPVDGANANNKKLDISSLMADTFVSISTTNLGTSTNTVEEYELAFTTAQCETTVDVTTSATVTAEFGFENYDVENIECAGRGECDRATGTCTCFEGYHGLNCGEQTILI
jgi:hypothetical protein